MAHVANMERAKGHVGNGKGTTTFTLSLQNPWEAQIKGPSHSISIVKLPYFTNNIVIINNTKKNVLQYNLMGKHALKRLGREKKKTSLCNS